MNSLTQTFVAESPRLTPRAVPLASRVIGLLAPLVFVVLTAQAFFRQGLVVWLFGFVFFFYDTVLLAFTAWNIRDLRAAPAALPGESVTFGVIVAAHNEASVIASTIDRLAAQDAPPEVILIADDGSSDDTAGVLTRRYGLSVPALGGMATGSTNLPSLRWLRLPLGGMAVALIAAIEAIDTVVVLTVDAGARRGPGAGAARRAG